MSDGDVAAQDEQTVGSAIVAIGSIFSPNEVVTLRRREEGEMRPGAGEIVGRRTVDENGAVGFVGFEQDELFWACGYPNGSPVNVRCVAKDPVEAIVFFQPAVQAALLSTGTAGTRPTAPPIGEPATPTDGTGIPADALSAAQDAQSGTASPGDVVDAGSEEETPAPATPSQPAAPSAGAGADPSPVVDLNPAAPGAGSPDSSESSGTGQANGGAVEQAPAETPAAAPDGTTTADASPAAPADGDVEFHSGLTAPDGSAVAEPDATPPADVQAPAAVTDQSSADVPGAPAAATPAPADTPSDAPAADAAQSSDAPAPAAAADSSSSAAAPAVDQAAADAAAATWSALLEQANGLGVENAATLSDVELRQAITEKGATPAA